MFGTANTFTHEQTTGASTWVVNHNLGVKAPIVDIWLDVEGETLKVIPDRVEYVNINTCNVYFTNNQIGTAIVA